MKKIKKREYWYCVDKIKKYYRNLNIGRNSIMSEKQKNSIKCIEMGDQLFGTLRKEYIALKNNEKFLSSDEIEKQRRILGAQYGLICEY